MDPLEVMDAKMIEQYIMMAEQCALRVIDTTSIEKCVKMTDHDMKFQGKNVWGMLASHCVGVQGRVRKGCLRLGWQCRDAHDRIPVGRSGRDIKCGH